MTPDANAQSPAETASQPATVARRDVRICNQKGLHARAAGQARIGDIGLFEQIADQPSTNHSDVVDAGRQIGIRHRREGLPDLLDFQLDRAFGVDPVAGDALVHAADQPRIRQHRQMRVEDIADLVTGGFDEE